MTRVKRVHRAGAALSGLVVVGTVAFLVWAWTSRQRRNAFDAYIESRKPYAAKALEEVGVLPDELRESSGLAVSRTQPGVVWSHNDSGDGPRLYAIDLSGHLLATIPVANAAARDWEDMASGPCPNSLQATTSPPSTAACLYLADTGDNSHSRAELTIYVVVEPQLSRGAASSPVTAQSFRFRYPGEPNDSEALAVSPNGDVTIVTKGLTGTIDFFGISSTNVARAITSGETLTAEYLGDTGIQPNAAISRLVTGAAVSPDGMTLAVRTYNEVFFYGAEQSGKKGSRWRDLQRPCSLGDAEPQGEAIDYLDSETLLLTSERSRGRPSTIHRLLC
jgi:hypothetical protein